MDAVPSTLARLSQLEDEISEEASTDSSIEKVYRGAKRGRKATEAERDTVEGTMSIDSAVWEFVRACDKWKIENDRQFIPQSAIFQIFTGLGYSKLGGAHKVCQYCASYFTPRVGESRRGWRNRRFCTPECALAARSNFTIPEDSRVKHCKHCGEKFTPKAHDTSAKWAKKEFCDHSCMSSYHHQKLGWTSAEDNLIKEHYPMSGSNIPELIESGRPRDKIRRRATTLGVKFVGSQQKSKFDKSVSKQCVECDTVFYPRDTESASEWKSRKCCSLKCAGQYNRADWSDEQLKILYNSYPIEGRKVVIEGKSKHQISREANRRGIRFIQRKYSEEESRQRKLDVKRRNRLQARAAGLFTLRLPNLPVETTSKKEDVELNMQKEWWKTASRMCMVCGKEFRPKSRRDSRKKWEAKITCSKQCTRRVCADHKTVWTDEEIDIVAKQYPLVGKDVIRHLNKTPDQLTLWVNANKIRKIHGKGGRKPLFDPWQIMAIKAYYPVKGTEVCDFLNVKVSRASFFSWCYRSGITRSTSLEPVESSMSELQSLTFSDE